MAAYAAVGLKAVVNSTNLDCRDRVKVTDSVVREIDGQVSDVCVELSGPHYTVKARDAAGLIEQLGAVNGKAFDAAAALQPRVQGFCDYIYARPFGDYRARCKVAPLHMGLLTPELTYVRPPFRSLWEKESEPARRAVERAGLLAAAASA